MENHGSEKKNKEVQRLLSEGKQVTLQDIIGEEPEFQGIILMKPKMEYTELIIEARAQKHWEGRIFNIIGVTPTGGYIALFNNGGEEDYALIDPRDVEQYSPVKNEGGILVPINMPQIEELTYIMHAKKNPNHNSDVSVMLSAKKDKGWSDEDLVKALISKYK